MFQKSKRVALQTTKARHTLLKKGEIKKFFFKKKPAFVIIRKSNMLKQLLCINKELQLLCVCARDLGRIGPSLSLAIAYSQEEQAKSKQNAICIRDGPLVVHFHKAHRAAAWLLRAFLARLYYIIIAIGAAAACF